MAENECQPCDAGKYCEKPGTSVPTGSCAAGYKCPLGTNATSPTPPDSLCDPGYYCAEETADEGTNCPPGHYCPMSGMTPDDVDDTNDKFQVLTHKRFFT